MQEQGENEVKQAKSNEEKQVILLCPAQGSLLCSPSDTLGHLAYSLLVFPTLVCTHSFSLTLPHPHPLSPSSSLSLTLGDKGESTLVAENCPLHNPGHQTTIRFD